MNRKINWGFIVISILLFWQSDLYGQTSIENEGRLQLHLSLPIINSFRIVPEEEGAKVNTGFGGITIGLDYYHSKNQFVHIEGSTATGAQFRNAKYGYISSDYISLSNNHKIKRITVGYGLSYVINNTWQYGEWKILNFFAPIESIKKSHNAFGLIFSTYFQTGKYFNIGIVYRPTLANKFAYEHLISIDFAWKIRFDKN